MPAVEQVSVDGFPNRELLLATGGSAGSVACEIDSITCNLHHLILISLTNDSDAIPSTHNVHDAHV